MTLQTTPVVTPRYTWGRRFGGCLTVLIVLVAVFLAANWVGKYLANRALPVAQTSSVEQAPVINPLPAKYGMPQTSSADYQLGGNKFMACVWVGGDCVGWEADGDNADLYDVYVEEDGRYWQPWLPAPDVRDDYSFVVSLTLVPGDYVFNGIACWIVDHSGKEIARYENGIEFQVIDDLEEDTWFSITCDDAFNSGFELLWQH